MPYGETIEGFETQNPRDHPKTVKTRRDKTSQATRTYDRNRRNPFDRQNRIAVFVRGNNCETKTVSSNSLQDWTAFAVTRWFASELVNQCSPRTTGPAKIRYVFPIGGSCCISFILDGQAREAIASIDRSGTIYRGGVFDPSMYMRGDQGLSVRFGCRPSDTVCRSR